MERLKQEIEIRKIKTQIKTTSIEENLKKIERQMVNIYCLPYKERKEKKFSAKTNCTEK